MTTATTVSQSQRSQIVATLENSEQYRGRRIVKSEDGKREYTVAIRNSDSRWTCGCMGWTRVCNPKGTDCKHIKIVKGLCGAGVTAAALSATDVVNALNMLLQDFATISVDEVLGRWLRLQDTALNLLTYFSMSEDAKAAQEYDSLFNSVKAKVVAAAMM